MKTYQIVLFSLTFFLLSLHVTAQDSTSTWNFGFNFGYNYAQLFGKKPLPDKSEISNGYGYRLGIIAEKRLSPAIQFKPKTEISFNRSHVNFNTLQPSYHIFPVSLVIMPHFTIEIPKKNIAPYILLGPNLKVPLVYSSSTTNFNTRPDIALDLGIGITIPLRHFSISPELRYSHGLTNVSQHPSLQDLRFNTFSFVLNICSNKRKVR